MKTKKQIKSEREWNLSGIIILATTAILFLAKTAWHLYRGEGLLLVGILGTATALSITGILFNENRKLKKQLETVTI